MQIKTGDQWLITAETRRDKPKYGTQLFTYMGRKYRGCQLHGDFLGYELNFHGEPHKEFQSRTTISIDMNEKDERNEEVFNLKVIEKLGYPLRRAGYLEK